jgi:hypothetical protein
METSLTGQWEVDPFDQSSLGVIGRVALKIGNDSLSEFIEMRDHSIVRLLVAHKIAGDKMALYAAYNEDIEPIELTIEWSAASDAVVLTNAAGRSVAFRRLRHTNAELWSDLSKADFAKATDASSGSLKNFLTGFSAFTNEEQIADQPAV